MGLLTDLAGGGITSQIKKARDKKKQKDGGKSQANQMDKSPVSSSDSSSSAEPSEYKRGGMVRKTGMALVHKGERVLTRKQQRSRRRKSRSK